MILIAHVIGEVDQKLGKTAFCGCIVAEDRGECSIAEWLRKALTESFTSASIIREPVCKLEDS